MAQRRGNEYPAMGGYGRRIMTLTIPTFDIPLDEIALPDPHFICLLCCDGRGISDRAIVNNAINLLNRGLVYLCAWGTDSARVRLLFENAAHVWNSHIVMLTVDLHETLDDALDYFLNVASPAMDYTVTCQTGLILSVGTSEWEEHIHQHLDAVMLQL